MADREQLTSIGRLLADCRRGLRRIAPAEFDLAVASGALVVDVRPGGIRHRFGELEGAMVVGLNVLEWRLAPDSPDRIVDLGPEDVVLLVCQQGFSSSLAAHRLQLLGLGGATDLVGGYEALVEYRSAAASRSATD